MLALPLSPNGRPNSDVIHQLVSAIDVTGRPRHKWIIDFGVDMPLAEAAFYEEPFRHVERLVKPFREGNRDLRFQSFWWLHGRQRVDMRRALAPLRRFVATPRVAKHRVFVWLDACSHPDDRLFVFAREDDYFFGVLHCRAHEVRWLATSSRHGVGNDPTYNGTTCFETFPLPWPSGMEPGDDLRVLAVAAAATPLDEKRRAWLDPPGETDPALLRERTLTKLYNARPAWLAHLHAALDRALWAAYGWAGDPAADNAEAILGRLLALNAERG
jgi:hypothetical protein